MNAIESRKLWVHAGGRCSLCNRDLMEGGITAFEVPLGEEAHIVGQKAPPAPRAVLRTTFPRRSVKIGEGYDPNSWPSGSLVDAHTTARYHVIWHLRPYNNYQWAARYWGYHIDPAN